MTIQKHDSDRSSDVQNRFLRWIFRLRGSLPAETLALSEKLWRIRTVSVTNPNAVKEPNLRSLTLTLDEEDPDENEYSPGGKFNSRTFYIRIHCQQSEVGILSGLSGRRALTVETIRQSIFEREEVLAEVDTLLSENDQLRRQVSELQAALQSMISGRPELPSRSPSSV